MLKTKSLAILLLSTSLIAACGGSSSSPAPEVNPFANGNVPTTKETVEILEYGILSRATLDPVNGTYIIETLDYNVEKGDYDPSTGILIARQCQEVKAGSCQNFDSKEGEIQYNLNVKENFENLEGEGLVLIGQRSGEPEPFAVGYNPSDSSDLPTGSDVVYTGLFRAEEFDEVSDYDLFVMQGKATTIVDFDNDRLDAKFTDLREDEPDYYASITGAKINGSRISGGEFSINSPYGWYGSGADSFVDGQFYGEEGQELVGTFSYGTPRENRPDYFVNGVWTGVKQ